MSDKGCECEARAVLLFPCSGGSNVGQIANAAAVELTRQGRGKMYCLAGIGAHVGGMVDSAAHADGCIAIDGCATACARKALEHAGIAVERHVLVTELGIKKKHTLEWTADEIARVCEASADETASAGGCGCCCTR